MAVEPRAARGMVKSVGYRTGVRLELAGSARIASAPRRRWRAKQGEADVILLRKSNAAETDLA
jgi:SLT domain-containing protein